MELAELTEQEAEETLKRILAEGSGISQEERWQQTISEFVNKAHESLKL